MWWCLEIWPLGDDCGALMNGLSTLKKEDPESSLAPYPFSLTPSTTEDTAKRQPSMNQGASSHQMASLLASGLFILDFQSQEL